MGKRMVILGAAESGVGAAVLAQKKGFDVFVSDMGKIKPHYVDMLDRYGIVSPEGRIIHVWSGYGTGVLKKKLEDWVK